MVASTDDPFADLPSDRTFVMPTPGQRAAAPARNQVPVSGEVAHDFPAVSVGLNPLVALANSVLAVVPQQAPSVVPQQPLESTTVQASSARVWSLSTLLAAAA